MASKSVGMDARSHAHIATVWEMCTVYAIIDCIRETESNEMENKRHKYSIKMVFFESEFPIYLYCDEQIIKTPYAHTRTQ